MSKENRQVFEFGPFRIDTVNRQLMRDGEVVPLKAKAVDTLLLLIGNRGDVVEKDDLMKSLWPDSFVEEANLTQNIYSLRKALGEGSYIETIPRRGYRFVAEVKEPTEGPPDVFVIREKTRTSISYEEQSVDLAGRESEYPALEQGKAIIDVSPARAALQTIPVDSRSRNFRRYGTLSILLLAVGLIIVAVIAWSRWRSTPPFEKAQLARFTTTGKAIRAAISPDGKYIAHVVQDTGQKSVWLRQIATGRDLLIVPASSVEFFFGLTFSHDGNYVYYVDQEMNRVGLLFQVPSLGGTPTKLLEDVDSPVTVSPDDKRLAFLRGSPGERSIVIANVDGSQEYKFASTKQTDTARLGPTWMIPPAWSPDGKTIAAAVAVTANEGEYQTIWKFDVDSGAGRPLTSERWITVGRTQWLEDGSGLLVTARRENASPAQQIWYVPYPSGAARKVTNDLSDYRDLSMTADRKTLIAVQSERKANLWFASATDLGHAAQFTSTNYDGLGGIAWTPDGKIVYTLDVANEVNLWMVDPKEKSPRQLTAHAGLNYHPVASADGKYIVFVSNRSGYQHLWRIDADGRHPQELTRGSEDDNPNITPDSRWVIYTSRSNGSPRLIRTSIDGGEPLQVIDKPCGEPSLSPDGTQIGIVYRTAPAALNQFAIVSMTGGEPRLIHELPPLFGRFHWTLDGRALVYSPRQGGIGDLWLQPLDGSAPQQLAHLSSNPIFWFDWSHDGKSLAYASGTDTSDVVLITDLAR